SAGSRPVWDVHPRAVAGLAAAPAQEADVERPERRLVPRVLLVQLVLPRLEAGLEDEAGRVAQPLGVVAVPCVDMAEVEHLRHARRRRREEAGRDAALLVELDAVEHVRAD